MVKSEDRTAADVIKYFVRIGQILGSIAEISKIFLVANFKSFMRIPTAYFMHKIFQFGGDIG